MLLYLSLLVTFTYAAPIKDLVTEALPGFPVTEFPVYSGFLQVEDERKLSGYSKLVIHYQFDTSSSPTAKSDPVAVWHTGGPGGSSIYGLYGEMGYFQVNSAGTQANPFAFNQAANMLYLESPAGSFLSPLDQTGGGFSYCEIDGKRQDVCVWNDQTQAAAYALTLEAFYSAFPEYASNDLYLIGESYAGQYIPNIAYHIQNSKSVSVSLKKRLKGIAVGNGCWGGDSKSVICNGPNVDRDMVALYHGKGLLSTKLQKKILKTCKFPDLPVDSGKAHVPSSACEEQLSAMDKAVGPHDVYNVYNNCPNVAKFYEVSGHSARTLKQFLHENMHRLGDAYEELHASGGGYDWTCGQFTALPAYFNRSDVRRVLHMPQESLTSRFGYNSTGPASLTLYPSLIKSGLRVLIYNGDADSCVPYIGNEEWTTSMVDESVVEETDAWHPWFASNSDSSPSGYATAYELVDEQQKNKNKKSILKKKNKSGSAFTFVTIRLAGHEVPHFTPKAALALFKKYLQDWRCKYAIINSNPNCTRFNAKEIVMATDFGLCFPGADAYLTIKGDLNFPKGETLVAGDYQYRTYETGVKNKVNSGADDMMKHITVDNDKNTFKLKIPFEMPEYNFNAPPFYTVSFLAKVGTPVGAPAGDSTGDAVGNILGSAVGSPVGSPAENQADNLLSSNLEGHTVDGNRVKRRKLTHHFTSSSKKTSNRSHKSHESPIRRLSRAISSEIKRISSSFRSSAQSESNRVTLPRELTGEERQMALILEEEEVFVEQLLSLVDQKMLAKKHKGEISPRGYERPGWLQEPLLVVKFLRARKMETLRIAKETGVTPQITTVIDLKGFGFHTIPSYALVKKILQSKFYEGVNLFSVVY
eukprot:g4243.t1